MKKLKLWASLILVVVMLGGGLYAWWRFDLRWRPKTIDAHPAEITKILEGSGWVSPGNNGPKLYMVSFRDCSDCVRYEEEEFPKLHKAGVDTRVIVVARPDLDGVVRTTPAERANFSPSFGPTATGAFCRPGWRSLREGWTAPGVAPADGDITRTAIVELGKKTVKDLTPLLKADGVNFAYPLLVWWTKDGTMRACACEMAETYRYVRKELEA